MEHQIEKTKCSFSIFINDMFNLMINYRCWSSYFGSIYCHVILGYINHHALQIAWPLMWTLPWSAGFGLGLSPNHFENHMDEYGARNMEPCGERIFNANIPGMSASVCVRLFVFSYDPSPEHDIKCLQEGCQITQ